MKKQIYYLLILLGVCLMSIQTSSAQQRELPQTAIKNAFNYINAVRKNPENYHGEIGCDISWAQKRKELTMSISLRKYIGKLLVDIRKEGTIHLPQEMIEETIKSIKKSEGCKEVDIIIYEQIGINGKQLMLEIMSDRSNCEKLLGHDDDTGKYRKISFVVYPSKTKGNYYWIIALSDKTRYNN